MKKRLFLVVLAVSSQMMEGATAAKLKSSLKKVGQGLQDGWHQT
jgi:hypothetical protein